MVGLLSFTVIALLVFPVCAMAQAFVPPTVVFLQVKSGLNTVTQLDLDYPHTIRDEDTVLVGGGTLTTRLMSTNSEAVTAGGNRPLAIARAVSEVITTYQNPSSQTIDGFGTGANAQAWARLGYGVSYNATQTPPSGAPSLLPVNVLWTAEASVTGDLGESTGFNFVNGNFAELSLDLPEGVLVYYKADPLDPSFADGGSIATLIGPSDPAFFSLSARVNANPAQSDAGFGKTTAIQAEVFADPLVEFDQARFDQMAMDEGFTPHDLSDYYELVYSPNIVPEPGHAFLYGAGLLGLVTLAQRRERDRARTHP